jgi:hypothetical protein
MIWKWSFRPSVVKKAMVRWAQHAATARELRSIETETTDAYLEAIVSDKERDWQALYERDVKAHVYHGIERPPRFGDRKQYMDKVRWDFDRVREAARKRLFKGLIELDATCYDADAMNELADRLHLRRPRVWTPIEIYRVMLDLPIIHQTTKHIGTPAGIWHASFTHSGTKIPVLVLTSFFNDPFSAICKLVVRRTFLSPAPHLLEPRPERYEVDLLQRHARMLFYLLGIWTKGEPYPTPEIDRETRDLVDDAGSPERLAEGRGIAVLKVGWCLFEALHEFSHVLTGDWLRAPETWNAEHEFRADRFAASCLLLEDDPNDKVWMLRGVHLFMGFIGLIEQAYGTAGRHPGAHQRSKQLYDFVRLRLKPTELELFDGLDEVDALAAFCRTPSKYGARNGDKFGS